MITGSSRGLGRAMAIEAGRRGARIGLIARSKADLDAVVSEVSDTGSTAVAYPADISNGKELGRALRIVTAGLGGIDVLVANAGVGMKAELVSTKTSRVAEVIGTNVAGTINTFRIGLAPMLRARNGQLVLVSSIAGITGVPYESVYSATKFAGEGLAEALAAELASKGIRVTTVRLGRVRTGLDIGNFGSAGGRESRLVPRSMDAADAASKIWDVVEAGRREAFIPGWLKSAHLVKVAFPRPYCWAMSKVAMRIK